MSDMNLPTAVFRTRRLTLTLAISALGLWLLLFGLYTNAETALTAGGAGGCGEFDEAVRLVKTGGTVLQMIGPKPTNNSIITRDMRISGGWIPTANCNQTNQKFTSTQAFIQYGFGYGAPEQKAILDSGGSVLRIEDPTSPSFPNVDKFVLDNLDLRTSGFPQYGSGVRGVLSDTGRGELYNIGFIDNEVDREGGGLYMTLDQQASLLIENSLFERNEAGEHGGALFMTLLGDSRLEIRDTLFDRNTTRDGGGGFELHVYDNAEVVFENVRFEGNRVTIINQDGGAGRIYLHDNGRVIIRNSVFDGNDLGGTGRGDALFVEMDGGELVLHNNQFINQSAGSGGGVSTVHIVSIGDQDAAVQMIGNHFADNDTEYTYRFLREGNGDLDTTVADQQVYLPALASNAATADFFSVNIISVTLNSDFAYEVYFDTNYETDNSNYHVHFFFDTVAPEDAGRPGSGPWKIYDGASPFTQYTFFDRPFGANAAERICALVANPDHSIRPNSGNCVKLP
ncbi:MAG: hypothetical protein KDD89_02000 [Anaerolineales bacterium]|nr:hypothetical protein [Anaerolineales bacterium]